MTRTRKAALVLVASSLLFSSYCFLRYHEEQRWLAGKAHEIVDRASARTRREQVLALRDYIRRHVRYEGVPQDGRPFLRGTARETLASGRGYCGEATRSLINLAAQLGIEGQRVNLYGPPINHVVAEMEIEPASPVLVDPQDNPVTNAYLDPQDRALDEVVGCRDSMFRDYSNIHLRRLPVASHFVQRIRMKRNWLTWTLGNPWLILADVFFSLPLLAVLGIAVDRLVLRFYAYRLGVLHLFSSGQPSTEPRYPISLSSDQSDLSLSNSGVRSG
jgi:hypothetical protein